MARVVGPIQVLPAAGTITDGLALIQTRSAAAVVVEVTLAGRKATLAMRPKLTSVVRTAIRCTITRPSQSTATQLGQQ